MPGQAGGYGAHPALIRMGTFCGPATDDAVHPGVVIPGLRLPFIFDTRSAAGQESTTPAVRRPQKIPRNILQSVYGPCEAVLLHF